MREKAWTRSRAALIDVHTNGSGCCCRRKDLGAQADNRARTDSIEEAESLRLVVLAVAACCEPATPTPLVLVSEGGENARTRSRPARCCAHLRSG